ncbi:MAG: TIGR03435 family protein [Acidobacteria bacterium]|nr:TIGR03435 family protein [Acidobacteriota bacterium]
MMTWREATSALAGLRPSGGETGHELARRALATGVVWAVLAAAPTLTAQPVEGRAQSLEPTGSEHPAMFRVRPDGDCDVRNYSLARLIGEAYGVDVQQVLGGPDWIHDEQFDIGAIFEPDSHAATDESRVRRMLQRLLWERFQLRLSAGRLGTVDVLVVTHAERLAAN